MKMNFGSNAASLFATNSSPFNKNPPGTMSGGLLGNSTATSTFGQPTTQPYFGGFVNTNTNPIFGIQQSANPFGTNTPTFNQVNNPTSISSTNPFGQPQPQQATPFGVTNTTTTPGFFNSNAGFRGSSGTVVKFTPVAGTDIILSKGMNQTIQVRHFCINVMKEYENKSLEELRLEDYTEGRKGSQNQALGLFHTPSQALLPAHSTIAGGLAATNQSGGSGFFNKPPITGFTAPTTTNAFPSSNPFNTNNSFATTTPTSLFTTNTTIPATNTLFNTSQNRGGFAPLSNPTQSNQSIGPFNQNKSTFMLPNSLNGFNQPLTTNPGTGLFNTKPIDFGPNTFRTNQNFFNTPFKPSGQTTSFSLPSSTTNTNFNFPYKYQSSGLLFGPSSSTFKNPGFPTFKTNGFETSTMPSLGMNQTQNATSIPIHNQILALMTSPFGDSPLLRNLLPASGKAENLVKAKSAFTINKPIRRIQYKISTNNSLKMKPKIVDSSQLLQKSLFDRLEEDDFLAETFQIRPNAKRLVLRPKPLFNISQTVENNDVNQSSASSCEASSIIDKENQEIVNSDARSSTSWLKSSINRKTSQEEDTEGLDNSILELRPSLANPNQVNSSSSSSSNVDEFSDSVERNLNSENLDETPQLSQKSDLNSPEKLDETPQSSQKLEGIAKLAQVKLQRSGYYTIPPVEKLDEYVRERTCVVPNFTVGRKGYGNVYFSEACDVFGLNLDKIIYFRHKEVIIYPDDDKKPPIGQGLNRSAQITLDRVWPNDKVQHKPITDVKVLEEINYAEKLRHVSDKHNTCFLEYRSETGSWVFKVEHF